MTTIPKDILRIDTFEGFYELYSAMSEYYDTKYLAYEAAEREYYRHYGKNKYSDYDSFRILSLRKKARKLK